MDISVYIDVLSEEDIIHLDDIVTAYYYNSVRPKEIIIYVFGTDSVHTYNQMKRVYELGYENVSIYGRKRYGDVNEIRNLSKKLTSGDIIMYHDTGTIPHKQKIEYISEYFENNDVYLLNHVFGYKGIYADIRSEYNIIDSKELYTRYFPFKQLSHVWDYTHTYGVEFGIKNIDMKSVCIRREVLEEIEWLDEYDLKLYQGNDFGGYYEFVLNNLYKYNRSVLIDIPLNIRVD